jgi:hypothetical protein
MRAKSIWLRRGSTEMVDGVADMFRNITFENVKGSRMRENRYLRPFHGAAARPLVQGAG